MFYQSVKFFTFSLYETFTHTFILNTKILLSIYFLWEEKVLFESEFIIICHHY